MLPTLWPRQGESSALIDWSGSIPAAAADAPVQGAAPPATADFLCLLRDEGYRFPIHDQEALGQWLPQVIPSCYSWPAEVGLVWNDAPSPGSAQQVLRVGPGEIMNNGPRQCGLVARWEDPTAGSARRASAPHCVAPPGDLFDAVALALTARQSGAAPASTWPRGGPLTAMTLRRELADWLQTPEGRQHVGPAFGDVSTSADDRPLQGPPWTEAPSTEAHVEAMARELATFLTQEWVEAPMPQPRPPDATLAEALRTLRDGGWSVTLDHLVPTVLVRLPVGHRCRINSLHVNHSGQEIRYARPGQTCDSLSIVRQSDGRLMRRICTPSYDPLPDSTDSFLEAAIGCPPGRLQQRYPSLREELAEILSMNPELVRLRLALFEQAFPGDHEVLLRLCRIHGQLTVTGEQLLDPGRPQRAVGSEDMHRWFDPYGSAFRRLPDRIAREGIRVLDAHRVANLSAGAT